MKIHTNQWTTSEVPNSKTSQKTNSPCGSSFSGLIPACRSNESWGDHESRQQQQNCKVVFHLTHRYMLFTSVLHFCSGAIGVNRKYSYTVLVRLWTLKSLFLKNLDPFSDEVAHEKQGHHIHPHSNSHSTLHHCQYDRMFRPKNVQKQGVRHGNR